MSNIHFLEKLQSETKEIHERIALKNRSADAKMLVVNGLLVDLTNLSKSPEILNHNALIKGLDNIIRFNGYSGFSVARHSFLLGLITSAVIDKLNNIKAKLALDAQSFKEEEKIVSFIDSLLGKYPNKNLFVLEALTHDFSEAITGDIIRPFKQMNNSISEIESVMEKQIREHFGIPGDKLSPLVDMLDKMQGAIEAYYLTRYCEKNIFSLNDIEQVFLMNSTFTLNEDYILLADLILNERYNENGVFFSENYFTNLFSIKEPMPQRLVDLFLSYAKMPEDKGLDYRDWKFSLQNLLTMSKEDFFYFYKEFFYSVYKN